MESDVEKTLLALNNVDSDENKGGIEAKQCVVSLKKHMEENVNQNELDLAFSALFDDTRGIICFLKKKISSAKYKAANAEAFCLLDYLIQYSLKSRISQHLQDIKHVCMSYVFMDRPSAEEKDRAFDVLLSIVREGPWDLDMEYSDLLQRVLLQVACQKKPTGKVLQKEYHLIGLIARYHPECAEHISSKILKQFLYELDLQTSRASKVEFSIITGCFNGLTEFLQSFPELQDGGKDYSGEIYNAVKKLAEPSQHRKVANRAAMSLISMHGGLFGPNLFKDYAWWHEIFQKWIVMPKEEQRVGFFALETFYHQMALALESDAGETRVFLYFIDFLKQRLLDANTPPHELRVTIKAFGQFAGACQVHMTKDDVAFMFTLIVQRIEQIYIQSEDGDGGNFSDYMIALATIMMKLEEITRDQLIALERITVSLVQNFPRQVRPVQEAMVRALTATLHCMAQCRGSHLDHFTRNVVYQGIVRSCSHPIIFDADLLQDDSLASQNVITYKSYVPLWKELFLSQKYNHLKISFTITQLLVSKLYDEFIFSVMVLMKKLDLRTRKKLAQDNTTDAGLPLLDPESLLEASTPKDFNVFINLVDLCRDVLPASSHSLFEKWVFTFCHAVIQEAYSKPLVSGFYKLLSLALEIADSLNYFDVKDNPDNKACLQLVSKFLQQVLAAQSEYKGDLQVACLQAVLCAPSEVVAPLLPHMHNAFQVIFQIGGSFLPLAHSGLDAIERWHKEIPGEQLKPLLAHVLKYLDSFLQSKGFQGDPEVGLEPIARGKKRQKVTEDEQGQLSKLQGRIVKFLGQLDSKTVVKLVTAQSSQFYVAREKQHLTYSLPFADMKPSVHLDEIVPRVIELALKSSDRRTRVMACELLHAIVMYMLGNSALLESTASRFLESLFDQLALPLLQLGCDSDQVVNQLFQPLVLQLVHWYSSKYQLRSKQSALMLEALMTGITHETDTALRDFAAKCLREFVIWSIKQLSEEDMLKSPVNIKAIIKRIQVFCTHPCNTKRLGAALIFNSIYNVLREEEAIVDQYWMEILYFMLVNLATMDGSSLGSHRDQIVLALDHIERVLRVKANLFNEPSLLRRTPPEMGGALLKDAVAFLIKYCSSEQPECRHKSMQLVCSLVPCIPDFRSASQYLNSLPLNVLCAICENSTSGSGISTLAVPTPAHTMDYHLRWFSFLLASLECYVWLIDESLVHPDRLFMENSSSKIFHCLNNLGTVVKLSFDQIDEIYSPWETEKYRHTKCSALIRTFDFITSFLRKTSLENLQKFVSESFLDQLFEWIKLCIFNPSQLGFEMSNSEVKMSLPEKMVEVLTILKKELKNTNEFAKLEEKIANTVNEDVHSGEMLTQLCESFSEDVVTMCQIQFVNGLNTLERCGMLVLGIERENIIRTLFSAMVNGQTPIMLQPKSRNHAEKLLVLGLSPLTESACKTLVDCLLNQTKLTNLETRSEITHGEHFLLQVKTLVMKALLESAALASERILSAENKDASVSLIIEILQHQAGNRKQFPEAHLALEESIHKHWQELTEWAASASNGQNGQNGHLPRCRKLLDLLSNFAGVLKNCVGWLAQPSPISAWVYEQIGSQASNDLNHKIKALELLPCLSSPDDAENAQLASALKAIKDQHFPRTSSELTQESMEQSGFVSTFQNILLGLEISGSRVILRSLIAMSASDNQHLCEPAIQSTLAAFISRLKADNQLAAIQLTYDIFSSLSYNVEARLGCVKRFTATLLQSCDDAVVKEFFKLNILSILGILNATLSSSNEWMSEQQLGGRVGAWLLVEIMFARIDKNYLEHVSCPITVAAFPAGVVTGKELIADLTRKAHNTRQLIGQTITKLPLYRVSQCAAYNALSAIISNTKTEIKFYNGLLFNENKEKHAMIWDRIVDTSKTYNFPLVCDELPTKRKQLVSIRKQQTAGDVAGLLVEYIPTNTQYLFNSTLNEDVTRFDFSNCVVRSFSSQSVNTTKYQTSMSVEIMLEDDQLNSHECMATLCAVIQHMVDTGLSPVQDEGIPSWMEHLKKVFVDRERHQNINLFIAKLILNCEQHFKPYSKYWVGPIMEAISDGIYGPFENNCLVNDLITLAASWGGGIIDKNVSCTILESLIRSCDNERREIYRHYLELTRTFVEIWKPYVDVPYRLLLDKLSASGTQLSRGSEVGIQLTGIFLANGVAPWNATNKDEFLRLLLTNMNSAQKTIYQPCSEVIGLTLKLLEPEKCLDDASENRIFLSAVQDTLKCLSKNQAEKSKVIVSLYGIYKYYSGIVDHHMSFLKLNLPKLYGTAKTLCMEMLWGGLELLEDTAYAELTSRGLRGWLTHEDSRNQELALRMIFKMARHLNDSQLKTLLPEVCQFSQKKSKSCRQAMYETLMWINENRQELSSWCEANNEGRATLIRGLVDSDEELQKAVYDHWCDPARLPAPTAARLTWLLRHLHTSQTEPHFLGCVVNLLLDLAARTPDFERAVFPAPLHDCRFSEYRVLISWRAQHATIAPMFAQTMASQLAATQASFGGTAVLRATQASLAFQPTMQGHGESNRFSSGSSSPPSSLLFTIGSSHISRRGQRTLHDISHMNTNAGGGEANDPEDANREDTAGTSHSHRRRFLKDQAKVRFGFAGRELRRQARRDTLRQEQARRRDANVSMHRSYRIGDFPDIEITNSAILKPLQALVKRDALLARQCFVSLFAGVMGELRKSATDELTQFTNEASLSISSILSATTRYTPTLMAALLNVTLNNPKDILLDTKQVAQVAQSSGLASLGCLLLEERLLDEKYKEPSAKRKRTTELDDTQMDWITLAELYRSLGEWDVVRAVFQQHLTENPLVHKALDHEAAGRWLEVRNASELALEDSAGQPQLTHYYRQSHFKSLAHLSEWDNLTEEIYKHVGGASAVDVLWADRSSRNEMLPLLILGHLHDPQKCAALETLIQGWMLDKERAQHLKNEFSEELSVLYILKTDYERARFYSENKKSIFLDKWSQMSPFSQKLRTQAIVNIQTLGEILAFLSFTGCTDDERFESEARSLALKWKNNLPTSGDSLLLWDTRMEYRFHFLRKMKWHSPPAALDMDDARSRMELSMVKLALDQRNFYVARKYIKNSGRREKSSRDEKVKCEWILAKSQVKWLRAEICDSDEEKSSWLMGAWDEYDRISRIPNAELSPRAYLHDCAITHSVLKILQAGYLGEDLLSIIGTRLRVEPTRHSDVLSCLEENVLSCLCNAANKAEGFLANQIFDNETQRCETVKTLAEAYLEMAKFNRGLSRNVDVATSVLRAMRHDSRDARQLFPWILEMPELVSNDIIFRNNFIQESDAVPEWMFLSWLNQILGCIDSPAVAALEPLVLRLATAYPNAVKYAFRLSKETFKYAPSQAGDHTRSLTTRLTLQLQDDKATEDLLDALSCFGQPEAILKYHISQLISLIDKKPANYDFFINKSFLNMMKESFLSRTPLDNDVHGKAFVANEKYQARLQAEYNSLSMEPSRLVQLKNTLLSIQGEIKISDGRNKLMKDYSPWLANFNALKRNAAIEIPGQYDGESKPLPQHHVKIVGFNQNVEMIPSARCPIRITIIGNNARDYPYLVKFGEDLRQDQRIQQLFSLMNKIFNQDSNCSDRQLGIATYQVIPLSSRHGLIQWVTHTKSLKQVMLDTFTKSENETYQKISSEFRNISIPVWCRNIFLAYSREKAISEYRRRVNMVPWDIFRRATNNLCCSPEEYFTLRQSIVTSYSTMAIGHWLLGIGDRHLSNCLIDTRRGHCLGIDFGFAFGTATHVIGLPELMPFRLTPHIVNLMQPMKEHGLFRETMLHCIRALRSETSAGLLLATMKVFIQEPSIDWRQHAWKATNNNPDMLQASDEVEVREVQFAQEKISASQRKLEGQNPAAVTCADLRLGSYKADILSKYIEVASGDVHHNVRASLPADMLSAEDQVKCLLDQATDEHILAKTYIGWEPWV